MPVFTTANLTRIKTYTILVGATYVTSAGARGIDMLYYGTVDGVTFTGIFTGSIPIALPPSIPYTLEYNDKGYDEITIENNGDADVYIVEKF